MKKIYFFLFFLFLIGFNILNVIDKVTTYYGVNAGMVESNARVAYFFSNYGLLPVTIFQISLWLVFSIIFYRCIIKISEKAKYAPVVASVPILFLIGTYSEAVVNNVRLLV